MIYQFINTVTSGIADVWIPITGDTNTYNGENGLETGVWKRNWAGNASVGFTHHTKIDPYSPKDFLNATDKKMTMGEMWDLSKEMSQKRASKDGIDHVQQKNWKDYEKKHGVRHQEQIAQEKKEKAKKNMERLGFNIEH